MPWSIAAFPDTPPHRRLKSLRLYDNPQTPKSLLQRSQRRCVRAAARNRLIAGQVGAGGVAAVPGGYSAEFADGLQQKHNTSTLKYGKLLDPTGPQTNINPFAYLSAAGRTGVKRGRSELYG
jgi:hypothetical protein